MSNFTVDDTAVTLVYGPGWGVASPSDPALGEYFQSTYHASESKGAAVNLTFAGSAIYLYGSQGPNRGNFSVRYDNFIENLSAHADTPQYQRLLFSAQLPQGQHSITFTNLGGLPGQNWVDLDWVTITSTSNNATTTQGFSSTISPLPVLPSTFSTSQPTSASQASSQASSPVSTTAGSSTKGPTLILAIVFGALLFFLLLGVAIYLIRQRCRRRSSRPIPIPSNAGPSSMRTPGSAFFNPQSPSPSGVHFGNVSPNPRSGSGHSQPHSNFSAITELSEPESEMRQTTAHPRPWSPFAGPMKNLFGAAKQGADSMKSTFLKV